MKILLVSLNSQYMHVSPAPYCLKAGIKAFSVLPHSVTVYSGNVNEDPAKILEAVERESPDLIGFCCYIWNVTLLKALLPAVKEKAPSAFLVFGGPEASFAAEELLVGCRELSAVLCGEGEKNFALLADVLEQKRSLSTVPGLCFRKPDGGFFLSAYEGEGTPPTPDREYVDAVFRKISYLESSRGCPFTCAFCLSGRCGKLRFFDLDRVFPAVDALAHSGSKIIKFVDRTFNADKKRAVVVWKYLLSKYGNDYPTDICFHFELAGELL
ncbi:MAG: cobalamin-dependent protein, partial [Clostridia bacterium]|nr:cobalamin-dependent protein [Clostridia bacterium]